MTSSDNDKNEFTYNTKVLKIDDNSLKSAKDYILNGEIVGFPTETVYGLGAIAYSGEENIRG